MHKVFLYIVLCFLFGALRAAELAIPSTYTPAPGSHQAVGLGFDLTAAYVNGLTVNATLTTTGDTTDRRSDIQTELNALPEFTALQLGPGDFYISSAVGFSYQKHNRYLIGSVNSDGSPATRIRVTGGTIGVQLGTAFNLPVATTGVPASFTKGATTLEVASSSSFFTNRLVRIEIANEATTPVSSIYNYNYSRGQLAMLTAKPDSTHITIAAPGLHNDFSHATSILIRHDENGFISKGNGIANIIIDATTHSGYGGPFTFNGIQIDNSYQSWAYNCKVMRAGNYGFYMNNALNCQFERVWAQGQDNGSSTSGFFTQFSAQSLVTDFVVCDQQYAYLNQYSNSGNVISYGICVPGSATFNPSGLSQFSVNHNTWNQNTLVEGLHVQFAMNDGYFGGTGYTLYYRNHIYGALGLKRLSRHEASVGNIHGVVGVSSGGYSLGDPYIGNSGSVGTTSMRAALSTLSTRTSASVGTITAPTGHGVTTGATTDVYWSAVSGGYKVSYIRRGVTVGTVSGQSVPISGGAGDDLPIAGSEIYLPTSNSALYDYSIDWDSSTGKMKEWPGVLTSKAMDVDGLYSEGTITLSSGYGASLQASLNAAYGGDVTRGLWLPTVGDSTIIGFIYVTSIVGDVVTFDRASREITQATGTACVIVPSPQNMPEKDMDVIATMYTKGNYFSASGGGGGIPSHESLGSDTLANSLYRTTAPPGFADAGLTWPPYDPLSPVDGYDRLPAGVAYDAGWWVLDATTVATPQFSPSPGTHASGTTLTITCGTSGATIHYTTNGDTPTTGSAVYSTPISLSVGTTVVKTFAVKSGLTDSGVQTGTYTLVNAPVAASGLNATTASTTQINVTWNDNSDNETGFRLERRIGAGSWGTVTTTAANATSYNNTGLTPATTYEYRVYAVNVAGDSTASNTDSATTDSEGGGGSNNATINQLNATTVNVGTLNLP